MKKIIALFVSLVLLTGCANLMPAHPAQTFADTAFKDVASNWSTKTLKNYAGPEFYRVCPPEKAEKLLDFFSKQLGTLKSYGTSSAPAVSVANSTVPGAPQAFVVMVDFEKGPANVTVMVGEKEGKWSLHGFQISSELLKRPMTPVPPPAPPATPATPAATPETQIITPSPTP